MRIIEAANILHHATVHSLLILDESERGTSRINTDHPIQMFQEINPFVDELKELDVISLSPIEALNKIYEWQKKYVAKR